MKWKALRQRDSCLNAIKPATLPSYEACKVRFALSTVFDKSIVMVIGPTPPGTGVMNAARALASLNATSPTRRYPRFFVASFHMPVHNLTCRCTFSGQAAGHASWPGCEKHAHHGSCYRQMLCVRTGRRLCKRTRQLREWTSFVGTNSEAGAQCQVSQDAPLHQAAEACAPAQGWCRHQ